MGKVIFFIISSLLVFATTMFFRIGGHKSVSLKEESRAEIYLLYQDHKGAYHKINDVIVRVEGIAAKNNLICDVTFGEYLDDPTTMEERHLRSRGGCLLKIKPDKIPEELNLDIKPAGSWLVGHFDGAPSVGPLKVYPKAFDWFTEKKLSPPAYILETYRVLGKNRMETEYLFPL
jgi:AraC family transcriptional regulator